LNYTPNFNEPRTAERIERALTWVNRYVSASKPNWLSCRAIQKEFGSLSRPLGKWLHQHLLICVEDHYNMETGKCKTYVKNVDGIQQLKKLITLPTTPSATPEEIQQLATGNFEYKEQSNRLWNSIQFKPSYVKRPLLAHWGYNYNYDIVCAAPRLVLQYAKKCGLNKPTPLMDRYVRDTKAMRQELADQLGMTTDQIKLVINSILNGSHISHKTDTSLFIELGRSHVLIDRLQASPTITDIKKEIKSLWDAIKPHRTLTTTRITPRDKSDAYRELEEQVIRSVNKYLTKTKNKGLMQHDGWTTCDVIDINELRTYVRSSTGYDLDITWEIYQ
jgi:hypothetical protein